MRWRDVRFEKPTEADGDEWSRILILHKNGYFALVSHENASSGVAWIPTSELPAFTPIPDPPEGWRFVEKGEAFDKRAKHWNCGQKQWVTTGNLHGYSRDDIYIVPIDPPKPPEPQYRPFANAAEFEPHENKWWRYKSDLKSRHRRPYDFDDDGHADEGWLVSLNLKEFTDGTPFGVKVEP
jgi:hypothetical protein